MRHFAVLFNAGRPVNMEDPVVCSSFRKIGCWSVELNFLGLPIRPGKRECPFYMRTENCKFSANCKFHHPDPIADSARDATYGYSMVKPKSKTHQEHLKCQQYPGLNQEQ
uniref:C3H1-type domain-containing protein n=1 Tax=Ananas comosus var. bracteatus TaxID=296719 RepID=A0A6V7Q2K9_ANACO|nr:unnamed protein product [Ananas comosus var. bracteatus]